MSNLPVRNLGELGIISDINTYDLPSNGFSAGVNVRFDNGNVTRAPVFRNVHNLSGATRNVAHMFSIPDFTGGPESVILVDRNYGLITSLVGSTEVDVTPVGIVTGSSDQPFTSCFLGNIAYLNRITNVPYKKSLADADFVALPNWDSSWRCGVLRPYKDTLVAMNVIKGANEYPAMVKWSDFAQYGSVPASWDETSTTNNAGENVLNEMVGPILDGMSLRDSFFIYGENEVWAMNFIGGQYIYDFRKRFNDRGIIDTNCVVEVDGLHYVFDNYDIYVHDGATPRSIIHGKNKDFVFGSLKPEYKELFFVEYHKDLDEVHFNYVSEDRLIGFRGATIGCNRAAVYNVRYGTWTFYDLPNVTAATLAAVTSGLTYEDMSTVLYSEFAGTYIGEDDEFQKHLLYVSNQDTSLGLSATRVLGLDQPTQGRLARTIEQETLKPAFIERIGIDMDDTGAPLTAYKSLLGFYPQIGIDGEPDTVQFQFGATDVTGLQPAWNIPQTFNPSEDNKLDIRVAGRYLAYRLIHSGLSDFAFSGFDVRVTRRGMR